MIHLVTVAKSIDVATYGIDKILKPFIDAVKQLEKVHGFAFYCCDSEFFQDEGVDFLINGQTYNFRGSLALIAADNLASQYIGGYKALNAALRKCRYCMATSETMHCEVYNDHNYSKAFHWVYVCVYLSSFCFSFWLIIFCFVIA